jgi:cobalamin-dependent methionine synthase I
MVVGSREQAVSTRGGVILEPASALSGCERTKIERDRRMDDVVVVDVGERLEVVERCGPNRVIGHGTFYETLEVARSQQTQMAARWQLNGRPHSIGALGTEE